MDNKKVFDMKFSKVFPLLIAKAERKGRTKEEVYAVTEWLTGYSSEMIDDVLNRDTTYGDFFTNAPHINENANLIKGKICGVRVESIDDSLMQKIRWLDKLVDELAKGKSLDRIMRK